VRVILVFGGMLIFSGLAWLGLSIISIDTDTYALTYLGIILLAIGIGLLVLSKILDKRKKASCNCCKCSNCSLDHDHWSH